MNFERGPRITKLVLIDNFAILLSIRGLASSSYLATNNNRIGASQNDLKI